MEKQKISLDGRKDEVSTVDRPLHEFPFPRKYTRHPRRLKVEVRTTIRYRAFTSDVSEDGMCFEIPEQLRQ